MHSGRDENDLIFLAAPLITGYDDLVHREPCECPAYLNPLVMDQFLWVINTYAFLKLVLFYKALKLLLFFLGFWQKFLFFIVNFFKDLSIGNWLRKGKVNRVIIVLKCVFEPQGVVVESSAFLLFFHWLLLLV